ncbi:hypothetical protein R5R35_001157 [Gryllus longicercus]|uniref:Uncharacterized protein n=1 Tax=Gryllus longicercus TaxID=2509291 RepID=A0AAN9VQ49_9ORTH
MNGHAVEDKQPTAPAEEKLPKYVEERASRGSFVMDMKGPIRPLDLGEDGDSKTPRQRRLLLALGLLVLLVVALVICLVVVVIRLEDKITENICETEECIRSADNLIQSMDTSVEPCNDFYKFACGRWAEDHPLPDAAYSNDWFIETSTLVNQQIQDYLETNDSESDPESVNQARRLYRSCMDTELLDELGLGPLLAAVERLGLGPPPTSWASPEGREGAASDGWRLEAALVAAQRSLGLDVLVGVGVWPAPTDRRRSRLTVATPSSAPVLPGYPEVVSRSSSADESSAPAHGHHGTGGSHQRRVYGRERLLGGAGGAEGAWPEAGGPWRRRARRHAGAAGVDERVSSDPVTEAYMGRVLELSERWARTGEGGGAGEPEPAAAREPHLRATARALLRVEEALERIQDGNQSSKLTGVEPDLMSVDELQAILDKAANGTFRLNLTQYLQLLFDGEPDVTLQLGPDASHERDLLQVYDLKYLKSLAPLLNQLSDRELQNYVWWKVVSTLAPYTDSEMRILKERYLEDATESFSPESRPHFCANLVNQLMGMAVAYFFYDAAQLNATRAKMQEMFADIRWAFEERVGQLEWMDADTKAATRDKAAATHFLVGFPDWLDDPAELDNYFQGITVEEDSFLDNLISISERGMNSTLRSLREINDQSGSWEIGPPMETNAAHVPYLNSVVVQAGIMQFPFFLLGLEALNYGAIGSIIGHELTHGFDDQGRKYDKEGNLLQWWSNKTVAEYEKRAQCFVEQYNHYRLKEITDQVDGEQTLGENIADNGGLREAFQAYKRYKTRLGHNEPKLPGLERYNGEQLFFLSFANVWCEKWTKQSLRNDLLDEHSPSQIRVPGVLVNSPEFSQVWKCPAGSHMNPKRDRCMIW